ncbi:hypothetical protein Hypma_013176 [Hypsizygus marmoreus]|uniref:Uncharacterized protein n=1 Tax=Hypsizygus marmoreus TaxID=39966 RepID=A0A369JH51_HYPMA|nr:hypothetical protein Hypma_013176 [Hypsizygus marmoreus]
MVKPRKRTGKKKTASVAVSIAAFPTGSRIMKQTMRKSTGAPAPRRALGSAAEQQDQTENNSQEDATVRTSARISSQTKALDPGQNDQESANNRGLSTSKKAMTLRGGASQRETFPICKDPRLVILSFRLRSIPSAGSVAWLVYHDLYPYSPDHIVVVDVEYDFGSSDGVAAHALAMEAIVNRIETGDLSTFTSFAVYITDHTDPERGDLHFAANNEGADRPLSVLDALIPKELADIIRIKASETSMLTILACGSIVTLADTRKDIVTFTNRQVTEH